MSGLSRVDQELATQSTGSMETNSVLVAEDDPLFRRILESWLGKWEYRVTAAEDGLKAWQVLENGNAPQLLILDWIMPGVDGIELCRRIRSRKQLRYPYILLLTARDDKQDLVNGLNAGADDYLTKPFDVNERTAGQTESWQTDTHIARRADQGARRTEIRGHARSPNPTLESWGDPRFLVSRTRAREANRRARRGSDVRCRSL